MGYSYQYNAAFEEAMSSIMAMNGLNAAFGSALNIVIYVLTALSLYTIAKRRGISKAWLAWIPVVDVWVLGSISDQFRYVVRGENKSKRKWLLTLNVLLTVISIVLVVLVLMMVVSIFIGISTNGDPQTVMEQGILGSVFGMLGACLLILGLSIARAVIYYMALYDLYTSCDPKNNVVYLVLSIVPLVSTFALPIFLFLCREKDEGMPPRKPEPEYGTPPYDWYEESNRGEEEWHSEESDPGDPWDHP